MTRLTTPKEMRQRRDAITAIRMGPKHDWVYRAAPSLGDTDTGVKLFDTNKSFAILMSWHCPGMATPSDTAPTLAGGHASGIASMAGSGKVGIRYQHLSGQGDPNVAWMGYGKSTTYFGFNQAPFKPYSQAGGRALVIHRSKALDEYGNPTNLDGGASFETCGVRAFISGKGTFTASATETMHVYSCEEIVIDQIVVYLRELTKEEEEKWRCYGALP